MSSIQSPAFWQAAPARGRKGADSKRLKHIGPATYLRGSDSRRKVASGRCRLFVLDELTMSDGTLIGQEALARAGRQ